MAELLASAGEEISSLAAALQHDLPDEYMVVGGAAVRGREPEALVVGPQGLFVLRKSAWTGTVPPQRSGPLKRLGGGGGAENGDPRGAAERDDAALHAFLRDEFPNLGLPIYYLAIPAEPDDWLADSEDLGLNVVEEEGVADAIEATLPEEEALDKEAREALALALHERRLTSSERAREPFVFRSGGALGSGKKVWTAQAMVAHIDRHPDDGIFHLRNGTLAQWLEAQRAEHLAKLARKVMQQRETEPRVLVEMFLMGTGLVARPRLAVRPPSLNLGYVLSGEACHGRLWLRKGRGRGYLYGTLHSSEGWLRVEPDSFRGSPVRVLVRADAGGLPISQTPSQAEVMVESNASAEPTVIPVRVRVVGMPSALNRRLVRPAAGALAAGVLGAGLGWALGRWALGMPGWLTGLERGPAAAVGSLDPALFWMAVVGFFWAVLGAIRGWLQPASWPVIYATARWLQRTAAWALALEVLAVLSYGSWISFGPDGGLGAGATTTVLLLAVALAVGPATVADVQSAKQSRPDRAQQEGRSRFLRRPITLALAGLVFLTMVVVGVPLLGRVLEGVDVKGAAASVREWGLERWDELQTTVEGWMDRLERKDERRTPVATPVLTPSPTPTATAGAPPP
jgi:multisubunit Na+/H+ antiporter MnhB subunit